MRRRVVLAGLVGVLTAGAALASVSPVSGVAGFGDVPEGRFYTEAVQWMVDNDITTGTSPTCFSPDDAVTRGQAAAFMWRMEGEPDAPPHPFTDINAAWQQEPVSWMYANGITTGTSSSTYSPNDVLTRGQLAALLHRLAGNPTASPHPFTDVVASWQQGPVSWMATTDPVITTGTSPTTFSPNEIVTRGQLATFFWRYKGKPTVSLDSASPYCGPVVSFGAGTHLIGSEIPATTYRAQPSSGCYWERLSGLSGESADRVTNEFFYGSFSSALVTISPSDVAFSSDADCGTWTNDLSPVTTSKTAPFGGGQYIVGVDIAAGIWRATGGDGCYWARLSGFSGESDDRIANDFTNEPPTVAIDANDVGFDADPDCGTWTKIG